MGHVLKRYARDGSLLSESYIPYAQNVDFPRVHAALSGELMTTVVSTEGPLRAGQYRATRYDEEGVGTDENYFSGQGEVFGAAGLVDGTVALAGFFPDSEETHAFVVLHDQNGAVLWKRTPADVGLDSSSQDVGRGTDGSVFVLLNESEVVGPHLLKFSSTGDLLRQHAVADDLDQPNPRLVNPGLRVTGDRVLLAGGVNAALSELELWVGVYDAESVALIWEWQGQPTTGSTPNRVHLVTDGPGFYALWSRDYNSALVDHFTSDGALCWSRHVEGFPVELATGETGTAIVTDRIMGVLER